MLFAVGLVVVASSMRASEVNSRKPNEFFLRKTLGSQYRPKPEQSSSLDIAAASQGLQVSVEDHDASPSVGEAGPPSPTYYYVYTSYESTCINVTSQAFWLIGSCIKFSRDFYDPLENSISYTFYEFDDCSGAVTGTSPGPPLSSDSGCTEWSPDHTAIVTSRSQIPSFYPVTPGCRCRLMCANHKLFHINLSKATS